MPFETNNGAGNIPGSGSTVQEIWNCLATTGNGQPVSSQALAHSPIPGSLTVTIGIPQILGDGVKTTDLYASADGGTTAKQIATILVGDKIYLNPTIAGFNTSTTDKIILTYQI